MNVGLGNIKLDLGYDNYMQERLEFRGVLHEKKFFLLTLDLEL